MSVSAAVAALSCVIVVTVSAETGGRRSDRPDRYSESGYVVFASQASVENSSVIDIFASQWGSISAAQRGTDAGHPSALLQRGVFTYLDETGMVKGLHLTIIGDVRGVGLQYPIKFHPFNYGECPTGISKTWKNRIIVWRGALALCRWVCHHGSDRESTSIPDGNPPRQFSGACDICDVLL